MGLDRDELAARVLCALAGRDGYGTDTATADAVIYADTLLRNLALTPTPAPVAPPAGKYEPKVGDVIDMWDRNENSEDDFTRVVTSPFGYALLRGHDTTAELNATYTFDEARELGGRDIRYLRDSTDAEKRAAGLAVPPPAPTPAPEALTPDVPEGSTIAQLAAEQRASMGLTASVGGTQYFKHDTTPAPEAKRPTLADVERSAEAFAHHKGDIPHSPSDAWMDGWLARDRAVAHDGIAHSTNAPCPPPVAGSGATLPDNVREFLLDVEHAAKWANQPQGPAVEYVKGRLKELAARAHDILTSPVRP